ncbi:MAG: hypothetical protein PVG89_02380 [Gammaproteobacteria bacterium]|jgi:hypothetical protein
MKTTELKTSERISRIVIGTGLIIFTMLTSAAPLGLLAVLPLVATYPIFAAIFGYDPIGQWIGKEFDGAVKFTEHLVKTGHTPKHS